jgi:hypothetical protein
MNDLVDRLHRHSRFLQSLKGDVRRVNLVSR